MSVPRLSATPWHSRLKDGTTAITRKHPRTEQKDTKQNKTNHKAVGRSRLSPEPSAARNRGWVGYSVIVRVQAGLLLRLEDVLALDEVSFQNGQVFITPILGGPSDNSAEEAPKSGTRRDKHSLPCTRTTLLDRRSALVHHWLGSVDKNGLGDGLTVPELSREETQGDQQGPCFSPVREPVRVQELTNPEHAPELQQAFLLDGESIAGHRELGWSRSNPRAREVGSVGRIGRGTGSWGARTQPFGGPDCGIERTDPRDDISSECRHPSFTSKMLCDWSGGE